MSATGGSAGYLDSGLISAAAGGVARMRMMKLVAVMVFPVGTAQTRDPTFLP